MEKLEDREILTGLLAILNYESDYKVLEEEDGKRDKRRKS